jgi:hypothetical protein
VVASCSGGTRARLCQLEIFHRAGAMGPQIGKGMRSNSALLTDNYASALRAQHRAAKRER